jgi:hypothetical protein
MHGCLFWQVSGVKVYRAEEQTTSEEILLECDFMWAGQQARYLGPGRTAVCMHHDEPCSAALRICIRHWQGLPRSVALQPLWP